MKSSRFKIGDAVVAHLPSGKVSGIVSDIQLGNESPGRASPCAPFGPISYNIIRIQDIDGYASSFWEDYVTLDTGEPVSLSADLYEEAMAAQELMERVAE